MIPQNENYMKNMDVQQSQFIMMGGDIKTQQKQLSQSEIQQIKKNYTQMYYAFTSINWAKGVSLGMAWEKALKQMDGFILTKTKMPNHPIGNELKKIHTEFRHHMAKNIMTNENAEIKLNPDFYKSFIDYGEKAFRESKMFLETKYQAYTPKQTVKETPITKKFALSQQFMQKLMLQMAQNQQGMAA